MVSGLIKGCTQYCVSGEEGALNYPRRRLKMKAKFELDLTSRKMHSGKMVRASAFLPDESELKFLLYYLFCDFRQVTKHSRSVSLSIK